MAEESAGVPDVPPKSGKLPLLVAAVVSLAVGAGVGGTVLAPRLVAASRGPAPRGAATTDTGHAGTGEGGEGEAVETPTYAVENIVLNPAGTNGSRYLLLTVAFVMRDAGVEASAKVRDVEMRDRIVALLGTQTVEELVDPARRDAVKLSIQKAVEPLFPPAAIRRVLLPQFVVQ